jgi:plasmid maintenance system antidote protein VapI
VRHQRRVRLQQLGDALLSELRGRLARGELTTVSLAQRTHFSQPHISNLLRGRRALTIESADALMLSLGLTTEDLLMIALDVDPDPPPAPAIPISSYGHRLGRGPRMHVHRPAA